VVLPDNVLFEEGVGRQVRADLMDKCNLHTVLRLPTGIFYAQGVKTNVLFFTKGKTKDTGNTQAVWFYDLRSNMPKFGKRTPFTVDHLQPFVEAYGDDAHGGSPRHDEGETAAFAVSDAKRSRRVTTTSTSRGSRTRTPTTPKTCRSRRNYWPRFAACLKRQWGSWRSWRRFCRQKLGRKYE
jgi:type I restriction-modification system DNA methylase subunit